MWPVIAYGAAIWGDRIYLWIEAVQNRAMRFFLGVGKYSPTAGVCGDMGWTSPLIGQWKCVCILWAGYLVLPDSRLNLSVSFFMLSVQVITAVNTGHFELKKHLNNINCHAFQDPDPAVSKRKMVVQVTNTMNNNFNVKWFQIISSERGVSGRGGNKLRKYRLFKSQLDTEHYCKLIMPKAHRSAFAKFRMGVAPLRIETGRYEGLSETERIYPFCREHTEDEFYVLFHCSLYNDIRTELFRRAQLCDPNFSYLMETEMFKILFSKYM